MAQVKQRASECVPPHSSSGLRNLLLGPVTCVLTTLIMASNRGHLRVVIFVLLRGVIFGVLGQAQGSITKEAICKKTAENGCCLILWCNLCF